MLAQLLVEFGMFGENCGVQRLDDKMGHVSDIE
jgi:hypothetical protein